MNTSPSIYPNVSLIETAHGKDLYKYMNQLKTYTIIQNKDKYDLILEFVNKLTKSNMPNLTLFKNINIDKISDDHFKSTLFDYKDKLEAELNIEIDDYKMNAVDVVTKCVKTINYFVHRRNAMINIHDPNSPNNIIEKKKLFITIMCK